MAKLGANLHVPRELQNGSVLNNITLIVILFELRFLQKTVTKMLYRVARQETELKSANRAITKPKPSNSKYIR
uniref:Uncharacterized protein n=1 Tax=Anguilla anguilla TaxID=7936 RepID=A0A0E9XL92_ANGAN